MLTGQMYSCCTLEPHKINFYVDLGIMMKSHPLHKKMTGFAP